MRWKAPLLAVGVMVAAAAILFQFFQRQISEASLSFGSHPEVVEHLEGSLDDLKRLADLDPANEGAYRSRFDEVETTVHRLQILEHTRGDLMRRYDALLLSLFALTVVVVTGVYAWRQSRHAPRLERLQAALTDLAGGATEIEIGERGRDTIGRIAAMIERTSRAMARDRRRLAALDNLSAWQEAARRHAHEMRTPLTATRLELIKIGDLVADDARDLEAVKDAVDGGLQELDRLGRFTEEFTSFARLQRPRLERCDPEEVLREFVGTYASAWPNLELDATRTAPDGVDLRVDIDKEMIRQVLVNLCDNSSRAAGPDPVRLDFRLGRTPGEVVIDAVDDGPGVPENIRSRVFEPYTTTRSIGEGMGLGLAICRKILLDHSGDLALRETAEPGTTFRLVLPATEMR